MKKEPMNQSPKYSSYKVRRFFREAWKDMFPWVLPGETSTSALTCLYCTACEYNTKLQVKKNALFIHQDSKKHQHAESIAKKTNIYILPQQPLTISSNSNGSKGKSKLSVKSFSEICFPVEIENHMGHRKSSIKKDKEIYKSNVDDIVMKVSNSFKNDVLLLLKIDKNIRKVIYERRKGHKGPEKELDYLNKLFVGHLAHNYLTENIDTQWKTGCPSSSMQSISNRVSEIKKKMNESYSELCKIQTQIASNLPCNSTKEIIIED